MPSLTNYFLFAGAVVLASLTIANFLAEPSTGATVVPTVSKPVMTTGHDLGSSRRNVQLVPKIVETYEPPTIEPAPSEGSFAVSEADVAGANANSAPLQVAPVALSGEKALRDPATPGASKIAKRNFRAERDRKRRAAHRSRTRQPREIFDPSRRRSAVATQQGGFSAHPIRESYGGFGWGRGW